MAHSLFAAAVSNKTSQSRALKANISWFYTAVKIAHYIPILERRKKVRSAWCEREEICRFFFFFFLLLITLRILSFLHLSLRVSCRTAAAAAALHSTEQSFRTISWSDCA